MDAEQQPREPMTSARTPDSPDLDRSLAAEFGHGELLALVILGLALTSIQRLVRRMKDWRRRIGSA